MKKQDRKTGIALQETTIRRTILAVAATVLVAGLLQQARAEEVVKSRPAVSDIVKASKPSDWRSLDPENTVYLDLPAGRVVIELAPAYAPGHVDNMRTLVREGWFDGLAFIRSQDNYVVQIGDPTEKKVPKKGKETGKAEFDVKLDDKVAFAKLPDADVYAAETGLSNGMPAARDPKEGRMWLAHCYGAMGAARGTDPDSGGGAQVYFVIGHAPRHLDRNVTVFGRVVKGMELLSTLPRGTGPLGFYEKPEQHVPVKSARMMADVPADQRTELEILRTDTPTYQAVVDAMRHRGGDWFRYSPGKVEVCNMPVAVRAKQKS